MIDPLSRRRVMAGAGASMIAPAALAGAAEEPRLRFTTAERSSGPQALSLDPMSHLRVRAVLCGVHVSAILDTGAARTVVDSAFAERLGVARRPGFHVAGITDNALGDYAEDVSISIGGLTLDHLNPGLLDLARVAPTPDEPAAAIIGRELFQRTAADFDFVGRTVSFVDAAMPLDLPVRSTVALGQTARGTPYVPVSIDGLPVVQAGLDIGYNASLLVSPDYAEQAGLTRGRRVSTVASVGVEGVGISQVVTVDRLDIAGARLTQVPVEIPPAWNRSIPAIIGLDIVKKFRMLTDYPHRRIGLFANPREIVLPLPKDRSGIGAIPVRGGLEVVHVAAASPAERIGLKIGDRIEAINGEPVDLAYIRSHPRMGANPAGSVFVLRLDGGRSVSMTLAEYY